MEKGKATGETQNAGFEIGVRKTFPVSADQTWDFLFSEQGLSIWLGEIEADELELSKTYQTTQGTESKVSILKPNSHTRLSWRKKGWHNTSILQLRVIDAKGKATVSFHQEKLLNSGQRDEMKAHWDGVLAQLSDYLN